MPLITILLFVFSARAEDANPAYTSADFAKLVKLTTPYVSELTEPVTTYNWHPAKSQSELKTDSQDEAARADVKAFIPKYWEKRLEPDNGTRGKGLYLAVDPVITRGAYGGGPQEWVLTEVRLPKRTRILNTRFDAAPSMSEEEVKLMNRLGCPMTEHRDPLGTELTMTKNVLGEPKCAALIQHLLKDVLKVDVLLYGYDSKYFQECDPSDKFRNSAFIVMSGDNIHNEDLRIFNHTTSGDDEERIRIQSLFTKERLDRRARYAPSAPPTTFTANGEDVLLWKDMDGKPYDQGLPEWIKKNIFACGKEPQMKPFDSAPKSQEPERDTSGESSGASVSPAP